MDKTAALASGILQGIGGEQNIQRLENCMTRVRVEVHDDDQLDVPGLKQLSGVSGYVKQGQQHQLIVGPVESGAGCRCHARADGRECERID